MTAKLTTRSDGMWLIDYDGPDVQGKERRQRISTGTRDEVDAQQQLAEFNALKHPKHPVVQRMAVLQAQANGQAAPGAAPIPAAVAATVPKRFTLTNAFDKAQADVTVWKGYASEKNLVSDLNSLSKLVVPPSATPLGDEELDSFTTHRLAAIYQHLLTVPRKGGKPLNIETARKHILRITRVCDAAHRDWTDPAGTPLLAHMPLRPKMAKGSPRTRVVQPFEEKMIADAIQHHREKGLPGGDWWAFGRLIAWCILHGTRIGETCYIGPECLTEVRDDDSQEVHVAIAIDPRMTKGGTGGRTMIIHPAFLPLVEGLNERASPTPLKKIVKGLWYHSNAPRWFPMTAGKAWQMWDAMRAYVLAKDGHDLGKGSDGLSLHNLRHTCATRLIEADVSLIDLQHRLGHTDVKITQQYVHADRTAERRIVRQIRKQPKAGTVWSAGLA